MSLDKFIKKVLANPNKEYKLKSYRAERKNNKLHLIHYGTPILDLDLNTGRAQTGGWSVSDQAAIRKAVGVTGRAGGIPRKYLGKEWQF